MLPKVRSETEGHLLIDTVILKFLTIFRNCQASSTFEAVYSACLSRCQKDLRPLFEMKWRPRAFCRVFRGDSDVL